MANPRTIARLEARILERAAHCLQFEIKDPRSGFITITRVELSPDVTYGKIHYSVMGGESEKSKAEHMLASAAGFIQRQVARVLDMRRMPRLQWVYDDSAETVDHVAKLIREARERDKAINPALALEPDVEDALEPSAGPSTPADRASAHAAGLASGELDADDDMEDGEFDDLEDSDDEPLFEDADEPPAVDGDDARK